MDLNSGPRTTEDVDDRVQPGKIGSIHVDVTTKGRGKGIQKPNSREDPTDVQRRQVAPPLRAHPDVRDERHHERRARPDVRERPRDGDEVQEAREGARLGLTQCIDFALERGLVGAEFDGEQLAEDGGLWFGRKFKLNVGGGGQGRDPPAA